MEETPAEAKTPSDPRGQRRAGDIPCGLNSPDEVEQFRISCHPKLVPCDDTSPAKEAIEHQPIEHQPIEAPADLARMPVLAIKNWLTEAGAAEVVWALTNRKPAAKKADWQKAVEAYCSHDQFVVSS